MQQQLAGSWENPRAAGLWHRSAVPAWVPWVKQGELQGHRELTQPLLQLWQVLPWRHCWAWRDVLLCGWLQGAAKEARENYYLDMVSIKFYFPPNVFGSLSLKTFQINQDTVRKSNLGPTVIMMTFLYPVLFFFLCWTSLQKTESWHKQSISVYSNEILLALEPDLPSVSFVNVSFISFHGFMYHFIFIPPLSNTRENEMPEIIKQWKSSMQKLN